MPELLLELFSEEIPARMQDRAKDDLADLLARKLSELGLAYAGPPRAFATPRRLAVVIDGLPLRQADRLVERRGPRADAPEAARAGFLRSLAGQSFRLEERDEKKARIVFALVDEPGRATADLLTEALPDLLQRFPWPKSMRWGEGEARWVRPLQGILCLLDGAVVPFAFAGAESGDTTRGHRFMAPEAFAVTGFADYEAKLRAARVILDGAERRRTIREGAQALIDDTAAHGTAVLPGSTAGLRLRADEDLLDELNGLVEWPVPLLGPIDPAFMDLPPEVLVTSMRTHQRYLALEHEDGSLAPAFVAVANIAADDGGAAIVAGNERVLRARLWDARFFWEQDKSRPLEDLLPKLDRVIFHEKLGTQGERVRRLEELAPASLALLGPGFDEEVSLAARAARLAKADLASGLVGEFPELQGIVGGRIAAWQGEPRRVSEAVRWHYRDDFDAMAMDDRRVVCSVALADRLDTLVGFFGVGIRPTGSKDPFALRRAALVVIKTILLNSLRLDVSRLIETAYGLHGERLSVQPIAALRDQIVDFLSERLIVQLRQEDIRHDVVAAVLAVGRDGDFYRVRTRAQAVQAFLETEDGAALLAGYRRTRNILAIEEKKDGRRHDEEPTRERATERAEKALFDALDSESFLIARGLADESYATVMADVARLRAPIDAFFDTVLVNDPDPEIRANRLRLLSRIRAALAPIADFSLIEDPAPRQRAP